MKYELEIDIHLPREKVLKLLNDPENMKHWMEGLVSYQTISGEPGQVGSKMELHFKMGKRDIRMIETITVRDLPDKFSARYETNGAWNEVKNFFEEKDEFTTKWRTVNIFKLKGFMKFMAFLMPGAFKKQSYKYLKAFKLFAESNN